MELNLHDQEAVDAFIERQPAVELIRIAQASFIQLMLVENPKDMSAAQVENVITLINKCLSEATVKVDELSKMLQVH